MLEKVRQEIEEYEDVKQDSVNRGKPRDQTRPPILEHFLLALPRIDIKKHGLLQMPLLFPVHISFDFHYRFALLGFWIGMVRENSKKESLTK